MSTKSVNGCLISLLTYPAWSAMWHVSGCRLHDKEQGLEALFYNTSSADLGGILLGQRQHLFLRGGLCGNCAS
ncbi:hypothetical protein HDV62DRAFT_367682 [Trichoderma sp. SZMC 28011]